MLRPVIRAAWIVVVACALAVPASAQDAPRGGTPLLEAVDQTSDAVVSAFATPTFGVSYITLKASDFQPWYDATYTNTGADARYCTGGATTKFFTANVPLPNGSRIVSIEMNVVDNDAASSVFLFAYQIDPGTGGISDLGTFTSPSGASTAVQTIAGTGISAAIVDTTKYSYEVGATLGACNSNLVIYGARVGYVGTSNSGGNDTPAGTLYYLPVGDRYADTRDGRGGKSTKFTSGASFDYTVTGVAGRDGKVIPTGATAVVGNVVAISPTGTGLFKILPGGTSTSIGIATVNFNAGFNTANNFTVRLDSLGRLRAYYTGAGDVDLVVDVIAYYK